MSDIFISYSRTDEQFVHRLVQDLLRNGREIFYDLNLRPGQDYDRVLSQQLRQAKFVLVVLSPDSLISSSVQKEVRKALQDERDGLTTVVPLLIRQCDETKLKSLISSKQYANFTVDYDSGFKELTETLGGPVAKSADSARKRRMHMGKGTVAIITTCIVAIVTLVTAYWQFVYKPAHSDHDEKVKYAGRVIDATTKSAVPGAEVSIDLQGPPQIYYSDSQGVFYAELPRSVEAVHIRVVAAGYVVVDRNVSVSRTGIEDVRLPQLQNVTLPNENTSPPQVSKTPSNTKTHQEIDRIRHTVPYNKPIK